MQGVIKAYDPATGDGLVMSDTDLNDYELAADALAGSIFRMLRQGQRVVFELDEAGFAHATAPRFRGRHGHPRRLSAPRAAATRQAIAPGSRS